ncbi:hypothetical protein QFC22_000696 [Naganishia vaughanmartiniae]|uniref:Uncharacterized protein n=1 Tax=Naganishia vaughanmartiniae TaxID=1424756 RepID=A0ACC2XJT1_9TREE|nr:hypothetical protein QFC22_000696 [Naganishia vaughanmartiniae]
MFATQQASGKSSHTAELRRVTTTQKLGLPEGIQLGASLSVTNPADIQHDPAQHQESPRSFPEQLSTASCSRSHHFASPFAVSSSSINLPQLAAVDPAISTSVSQAHVVNSNQYKPLPLIPPYALSASASAATSVPNSSSSSISAAESSGGSSRQRPPPLQLSLPPTLGLPLFSAYPVTSSRRRSSGTSTQPPSSYKGKEREAYLQDSRDGLSLPNSSDTSIFATNHTHDRRRSYHGFESNNSLSHRRSSMSHSLTRHHGPPLSHSAHFAQPLQSQVSSHCHPPSQNPEPSPILEETPFTPTTRRKRALTLEQQNAPTVSMDLSADGRRRSVDQANRASAPLDIGISSGWLPPGALPAVNPASKSTFELTAKSQYDALGGIDDRIGSPVNVIRVSDPATSTQSSSAHKTIALTPNVIPGAANEANVLNEPFPWASTSDAMFTLQSVSTIAAGVPLASPAPSQRSHAAANDFFSSKTLLPGSLGLTGEIDREVYAPRGPHGMDFPALQIDTSGRPHAEHSDEVHSPLQMSPDLERSAFVDQGMSMPSLTETSSGACTAEFLLSSASTSLSRSTKNGKEKEHNGSIQVVQDGHQDISQQLSLALETQLETKKSRVDKRKYILVELIETEMAYTDHLRDLVHIYLPQLAALSIVSPSQHATIGRNLKEMLYFHEQLTNRMVDVLKEEGFGTNLTTIPGMEESVQVERIARKIAAVFVEDASGFDMYDKYCSGAAAANNVIRDLQFRPEWTAFEKRCRIVIATRSNTPLQQVLAEDNPHFQPSSMPPPTVSSVPSRLMLRDLLILPVQRICRYPLVLSALMNTAAPPSPSQEGVFTSQSALDVGVDVERAMYVMQNSAARANVANRRSMVLARTAIIARRLEYHPSTVKVRYMGAFLYYGFLVLAKVKKAEHYEIKHYLPLQMFEMVDVTEGFLPHSIRLSFRDHHIELAAACAEEKNVWATALCEARDNSTISPFDLPCSVAYGAARSRRGSTFQPGEASALSPKRYSLGLTDFGLPGSNSFGSDDHDDLGWKVPDSPHSPTVPMSPMRREGFPHRTPSRILMRRASPLYRLSIDSNLQDVVCDECNIARAAGRQMAHDAFGIQFSPATTSAPGTLRSRLSMKDSSVMRRRRSYVDVRSSASTDTVTSTATVTNSISRAMSGYGNNMASSFRRGFSISSQEGHKPRNRLSTGSLEGNLYSGADSTTDIDILSSHVLPSIGNHRALSDDHTRTTAISVAQQRAMQSDQLHDRARSQSEIMRRRSMQNLTILNTPMLSGSETDHEGNRGGALESGASGATTPSHGGEYTTVDVFALGAGLTNALSSASCSTRPGLLSRTMSFASQKRSRSGIFSSDSVFGGSRRNSVDHAKALPSNALTFSPIQADSKPALASVPGSPTGSLQPTAAPITLGFPNASDKGSGSSEFPSTPLGIVQKLESAPKSTPSLVSESPSTNTSDAEDAASSVSIGAADRTAVPKRRRSVRFLHRLNKFTSLSAGNPDK